LLTSEEKDVLVILWLGLMCSPIHFEVLRRSFFPELGKRYPDDSGIFQQILSPVQGRIKWMWGPGKNLIVGTPKRLGQLHSVSHALVSILQTNRSEMSKLINMAAYITKTIGGDHLRRFVCG